MTPEQQAAWHLEKSTFTIPFAPLTVMKDRFEVVLALKELLAPIFPEQRDIHGLMIYPPDRPAELTLAWTFPYTKAIGAKRRAAVCWREARPSCQELSEIMLEGLVGYALRRPEQIVSLNVSKVFGEQASVTFSLRFLS